MGFADRLARIVHAAWRPNLLLLCGAFTAAPAAAAQDPAACFPEWLPSFGELPGVSGADAFGFHDVADVRAQVVFDDGSGPALYVGGTFVAAGADLASFIARWDGHRWSAVDLGTNDTVRALAAYDDGSGPALYAGGQFTEAGGAPAAGLAKWDGQQWTALPSELDGDSQFSTGPAVHALEVYDDGSGPALFAGGEFTSAGGQPAANIACWDGAAWSSLAGGMTEPAFFSTPVVDSLCVYDDGGGQRLVAGGNFLKAGGVPASHIAAWDGAAWAPLGSGTTGISVRALEVFDDGAGEALYVGGAFPIAGGITVNKIARWDGNHWSALSTGVSGASVNALEVFDDGGGAALYVGGEFAATDGFLTPNLARWDGQAWTAVGAGTGSDVHSLLTFDPGTGPRLYVGGEFLAVGSSELSVAAIASWGADGWHTLGAGPDQEVLALEVYDAGSGPEVYVGGAFTTFAGETASGLLRWDGDTVSVVGVPGAEGVSKAFGTARVHALTTFQFLGAPHSPSAVISTWQGCSRPTTWPPGTVRSSCRSVAGSTAT